MLSISTSTPRLAGIAAVHRWRGRYIRMKLGRSRDDKTPSASPPVEASPPPGPHLLREHGLLAPWFVAYRLDEELERARRHEHPIAIIVAEPQLLPGEDLPHAVRAAAADAAMQGARTYDLAGWLDARRVVLVMPDTQEAEARAGAERLRTEMWRRSTGVGGQKWTIMQIADARSFADAQAFLQSLDSDARAAA